MVIFAILTLLIHESIIYFHLLIFFQIMSSVTSIFYPTSFSLTWLELFQVFYVIWSYYKRCCFHNFFLSTLVYMKDTDFCVFFVSNYIAGRIYQLLEFPVRFFNVPYVCYHIVHKLDTLASPFPIFIHLLLFCYDILH